MSRTMVNPDASHLALTYKPVPENNVYYYTYVQGSTALHAIQAASSGIQMAERRSRGP